MLSAAIEDDGANTVTVDFECVCGATTCVGVLRGGEVFELISENEVLDDVDDEEVDVVVRLVDVLVPDMGVAAAALRKAFCTVPRSSFEGNVRH